MALIRALSGGLVWLAATIPLALTGRAEPQPAVALSSMLLKQSSLEQSLADEYGQAIITELAQLMSRRMDAACVKSGRSTGAALSKVAADILLRYGRKAHAFRHPDVDPAKFEATFLKIAGPQALSEMRKFVTDGTARRFKQISEPLNRDTVVEITADDFDRYLHNANLTLGQTLAPISSGNVDIIKLGLRREQQFHKALEAEISKNPALRLFVKHVVAVDSAAREVVLTMYKGVPPESAAYTAFKGVDVDLRNACVRVNR